MSDSGQDSEDPPTQAGKHQGHAHLHVPTLLHHEQGQGCLKLHPSRKVQY